MDRIQEQASELWELIFKDETAETYQAALNLTGKILTDTARLLWLIICSVFVFGAWFSDASVKAGNNIRLWLDRQTNSDTTTEASKPLSETSKDVLDKSRTAIVKLVNKAREELGLEAEPLPTPTKKADALAIPAKTAVPSAAPKVSSETTSPVASQPESQTASPQTTTPPTTKVSDSSSEDLTDDMVEEVVEDDTAESWPPQATDD
ncbi:hypothetical protein S7335_2574 [Synechococcus sp. PCC 7335]|uniref:hypothetical protein n=1 Tax=Synechococcus sp. (strain ATCC 29403 / PCC 7335) TaxID=91464 RepID=UPI00017EE060|nr:hypothetical protein [Synechococcus sp. PCC 7335]EDX84875.1 hypothetical protein S7335_2574 [Synechococcus sp. PCC 7335]